MAAPVRRRKMIGHRRRVEDEGEDEGGIDQVDADDDSLTDGSVVSDDHDLADDSDTSNVDEASPTTPTVRKPNGRVANGNGTAKRPYTSGSPGTSTEIPTKPNHTSVNDTEFMLNGLTIADTPEPVKELSFEDEATEPPSKTSAPIVVSSNSAATTIKSDQGVPGERRRKDHGDYRRQKEENPAFVPNRGAFFMHDHRHAGPSANGFRPFGRGGRGRGRGGIGGPFAPMR
ncbi:hypothetical protein SLS62_007178 [Diatrype stigma]|uniref:Btz domain-containing protein n=1 Tax=Diatrype stigma TaxID=117547 RepID=A0AAN9UM89_9PEZI